MMNLVRSKMTAILAATLSFIGFGSRIKTTSQTQSCQPPNHLKTVNRYGEFTWQMTRVRGQPVAVINRKGALYCRLVLWAGYDYSHNQAGIVAFLQERLSREARDE